LPPTTSEDPKDLVEKGNWELLILNFSRRGLFIAGQYIKAGGEIDEMVGAAMLGICIAVDKMKNENFRNINPGAYITAFIHQHCHEALRIDTTISVPRWTKRIHTCVLIDSLDGADDFDIIEFDEILEKIAESEFEQEVINYRTTGYRDDEIAVFLGVSRSTISRTRSTLYERYCYVRDQSG
jgi:hypothetical protein